MKVPRRWADLGLRTRVLLVLSVPLVPLLLSTGVILLTARQQRTAQQWVAHTLEVKAQIAKAAELMVEGEAATKDFLLTRDPDALRRFQASGTEWPKAARRLLALVIDNPDQVKHGRVMASFRDERPLVSLLEYVRLHPSDPTPPAELLTRSRLTLSAIRSELLAMQAVEDNLLTTRVASARRAQSRLVRVTFWGALFGVIGSVVAAISFSRASQSVERARSELDQFFSVSLDMLCIADTDGSFKRVNPAWQDVLGWTPEELTSKPYLEFIHPGDVEMTRTAASRQGDRDTIVSLENRYRAKDGSYRWLQWKSVSRPETGSIFAAARDVTDQKRINTELQASVGELKELNEELEAFTYSVSHDLRAPLRHITGFSAFLERSSAEKLNDQERRWLSLTIEAGRRMGRLIDDLLAFSRMGRMPITRSRVNLDDIVSEARNEASGAGSDGHPVEWVVSPLPEIEGDGSLLRLAFVNLIGNALKYTRHCPHARVEIGTCPNDGGEVVIFVRDNGVGFDMQYAHKLFGVFQRLHDSEEFDGTGIGLANVRRIIQRHGGRAWAEGAVNQGATFYISLPSIHGRLAA